MSQIKQSTLNGHVNPEAIDAYRRGLYEQADRIEEWGWLDGLTEKQEQAVNDLRYAAGELGRALGIVQAATASSRDVFYRLYNR